jgi:hypothetical protein
LLRPVGFLSGPPAITSIYTTSETPPNPARDHRRGIRQSPRLPPETFRAVLQNRGKPARAKENFILEDLTANWSASPILENDERLSTYGRLAPKTKADFAFVQHMVHHLDNGVTMACVLPHGVLFHGAAEAHIRRYLIEDCNYLAAVIGLLLNIFLGTGIPTSNLPASATNSATP